MFCSLFSGSSGNCIFIKYKTTKILIDCGVSGKKIATSLNDMGIDETKLSAILVTHEHKDHINSVGIMSRRYNTPIYASLGTIEGMLPYVGKISDTNLKIVYKNKKLSIGDIDIEPFSIPHDANEPYGFNFYLGSKKLSVATDIGHISESIKEKIIGCDTLLLESNHDINMLMNGSYPYYLKKRIASKIGHLSNESAGELSSFLAKNGTSHILLGHLSSENNTPELAFKTVENALIENGITPQKDVSLKVANREATSHIYNTNLL